MRTVSDIIWFNDYLKFNGKPFIIKHWASAGILRINDLIKGGQIDEGTIFQKLVYKAGFVFELSKMKASLPQIWNDMSNTHQGIVSNDKTDILEMQLDIPNKGVKSLNGLTSRDIYEALLLSKQVEMKSKKILE